MKKVREDYAAQGEDIQAMIRQYKKEIDVVLEELNKLSFMQKGLRRGERFLPPVCVAT